jgi:uridine kinase
MKSKSKKSVPLIIGICGRTCSGKSSVAKALEKKYHPFCVRIGQDKFFKKIITSPEEPSEINFDKLISALKRLKSGKSAKIPGKARTEIYDRLIEPKQFIIVEGFLLFVNEELNTLFDKKIFFDVSDLNLFFRRIKRGDVNDYFAYTLLKAIPKSKKFEKIQKSKAEIIINANKSHEGLLKEIEQFLELK